MRESKAKKHKRAAEITQLLYKAYPDSKCSLHYKSAHELLVATILSAQCTDHRVNIVTEDLFLKFDGQVPDNMDDLAGLPGVGRKTANCILGEIYNVPAMVIDTHMIRIMGLLGFTKYKDPKKIELDIMELFDDEDWVKLTHMVIDHGRTICVARHPRCSECILVDLCPSSDV